MDTPVSPTHSIDFKDQVLCVEFSQYEWSQNLICIAFSNRIAVGVVKFQEDEDDLQDELEFTLLHEFHHEVQPHCLAWNPDTTVNTVPKCIAFCTAGGDYNLRLFNSDLANTHNMQVLEGHTNYVNSIMYDPDGEFLASGSDDFTCRIWNVKDFACVTTLNLHTAVMSVRFHSEEPGKLMVGLKKGKIVFVNMNTQQRIMTFECSSEPLLSADWAPSNSLRVAAIAELELAWWDVSKSRNPIETRLVHTFCGRHVRYSSQSEHHIATFGEKDHQLKVYNVNTNMPLLTAHLQLMAGGISWHHRLPYICAGNDRKVCLWKVPTK